MALLTALILGATAGASVLEGKEGREAAKKQEKEQERIQAVESRLESIRAKKAIATQERQRRIQTARADVSSVAAGTTTASSTSGVTSSIGTQAAANIGTIQTQLAGGAAISSAEQKITDIQSGFAEKQAKLGIFKTVAGAGKNIFESL